MFSKIIAVFACIATVNCGLAPLAYSAAYVSPYASTYNAHTINHAVATPFVSAPAAKIISPFAPAARYVSSPYVAAPFAASPYSLPYSSPLAYSPYAYPSNYYL